MRLHGINQPIKEILEKGFYTIPRFQRPYSWEEEHVTELWNDLINNYGNEYFIGSIVTFVIDQHNKGVVDGQQRLMTLTIMLAAIRDKLFAIGESDLAEGIQNFIEKKDVRNKLNYVVQQENSYPYFQSHIQSIAAKKKTAVSSEEKRIEAAYNTATQLLEARIDGKSKRKIATEIEDIRDKILSAQIILIQLESEDDAYIVFEILNSRGKNLSLCDLLKNHILRLLPTKNEMLDSAKDSWKKIESSLISITEYDIDDFFRHFYNSHYGSTPERDLYKNYKKIITKKNASEFITQLESESSRYEKILNPNRQHWRKEDAGFYNSLAALRIFAVSVPTPLLLTALRKYENKSISRKQFKKILDIVESFHFEYTAICSRRSSGGLASLFGSVAKGLESATGNAQIDKTIKDLSERLDRLKPPKEDFCKEISKIEYSSTQQKHSKLIRYIFSKYDSELHKHAVIDWNLMTIEHFLAQNASLPHGTTKSDVSKIGNLFLLSPAFNIELGNLDPAAKVRKLAEQKCPVDAFITKNATKWNDAKIKERSHMIGLKLWKPKY